MLATCRGVGHISGKYGRFRDQPPRELAIATVAERQHNLIHLTQLQALGLSANAVRKRAARGRLHRIYQGV
jgi:Transcriptional regulator, AbiEi antitoxin